MSSPAFPQLHQSLSRLLAELAGGSPPDACFVLNPNDPGLLASLDRLSAEAASTPATAGGASIAAHVDHLRYSFKLLNRWSRDKDAFADADFSASWRRGTVTPEEWLARLAALRQEIEEWQQVVATPRELTSVELTGLIAAVVHLAYHLGAIRQIDPSLQGPKAAD
jgi:hypothetical protein